MHRAAVLLAILLSLMGNALAEDRYVFTASTNAPYQMQVVLHIPGFPHSKHVTWHLKPHGETDPFDLGDLGPMIGPSMMHSRQKSWSSSLLPKGQPPFSNLVYQLTYRIREFATDHASTNRVSIDIPMGMDFAGAFDGVVVTSKWTTTKAEQDGAPLPRDPQTGHSEGGR